MVSSVQNNPFPQKGHSCPLKLPLCNRSCVQYHFHEIIPYPSGLHIVSYLSPPFLSNLCLLYNHRNRFATFFCRMSIISRRSAVLNHAHMMIQTQHFPRSRSPTHSADESADPEAWDISRGFPRPVPPGAYPLP